ncbi:unnamed protein product, partial [Prorocentrum cordatum]
AAAPGRAGTAWLRDAPRQGRLRVGPLRGAATARAAADNLVGRLSKELEVARKECQFLQDAFASAFADGDIGDRILALVPALRDLVNGRRSSGLRRLRRNVALHAVAEGIDSIATAGVLRRGFCDVRGWADGLNLTAPVFVPGALAHVVVWQSADEQVDALLQVLAAAAPVGGAHHPDAEYAECGGASAGLQLAALPAQQERPPVPPAAALSVDGSACADGGMKAELPHGDGVHDGSAVYKVVDGFADPLALDGRDCECSAELEDGTSGVQVDDMLLLLLLLLLLD